MKKGFRMVRESERSFRAQFSGCKPLDIASNAFLTMLRKNRHKRAHSGYRLPNQRRAYEALNVMGRRIWVNKPRFFAGNRWLAENATVSRSIERERRFFEKYPDGVPF